MKKLVIALLFAISFNGTLIAHALPQQAEADKLMLEATAAMKAQDFSGAVKKFARVKELNAKVPETFTYHYGVALAESGDFSRAIQQLDAYITKEGENGKFYKEALEIYTKTEARQAEAARQREEVARQREEAARQAEAELRAADKRRHQEEVALNNKLAAEARNQLQTAKAGDINAMYNMAIRYDAGVGVKKDLAEAEYWRNKAEAATAQGVLNAAISGDIKAMNNMAERYDTGQGVDKDPRKAQAWREKIADAERATIERKNAIEAQEKAQRKQQEIDNFSFFPKTKRLLGGNDMKDPIFSTTMLPFIIVSNLLPELISAPSKTSELNAIKNAAALRPSTWGKPDSMIAKASFKYKGEGASTENPLVVIAAK